MTARIFKSRDKHMSFPTRLAGLVTFANFRCITDDQNIINAIEQELIPDRMLGIYVDPNEMEMPEVLTASQVQNQELQEYLRQKELQRLPDSSTDNASNLNVQSAAQAAGRETINAPRFASVANNASGMTPTTSSTTGTTSSTDALRAALLARKSSAAPASQVEPNQSNSGQSVGETEQKQEASKDGTQEVKQDSEEQK